MLLDELPDAARREMLAERFVPGHDIDELVEQIAARAGGNAFFIQELLDTLIERGILVADGDDGEYPGLLRWVKRDAPIHVPSTVEDLILDAHRLAAAGRERDDARPRRGARPPRLGGARVARCSAARCGSSSTSWSAAACCRPHDGEYRFKNDMTMTVAYGLIPHDVARPDAPRGRGADRRRRRLSPRPGRRADRAPPRARRR